MKLITVYGIVDRLKINGSCARAGIRELVKQGKIGSVEAWPLHSHPLLVMGLDDGIGSQ